MSHDLNGRVGPPRCAECNAPLNSTSPTTAGFLWDSRRVLLRGFRFDRGIQNVQLSYSAGYSSVPLDLRQAAIEAFALSYRQRVRIGEKSNSMNGQVNISFDISDVPAQTLGGKVSHCRIEGKIEIVENVLGAMALAVVPVEVLATA